MTNDTPATAALRARFEEFAIDVARQSMIGISTDRNENGYYIVDFMNFAWQAFQACAKCEPVPVEVIAAAKQWRRSDEPVSGLYAAIIADWAIEHMPQLKGANDGT